MLYPLNRRSDWMNQLDISRYEGFLEQDFHAGAPISFESVSWNRMIRDGHVSPQRAHDQLTAPDTWSVYGSDPRAHAFKEDLEHILAYPQAHHPQAHENSGIRSALGTAAHGILVGAAAIAAALGGLYFSYRAHNAESMPVPPVQETYVQNTIMVEPGDSIYGTVERYLEAQNPGIPDEAIDRAVALVALENSRMPPQLFDDLYPEHAYPDGAYLKPVLVDAENINPHQPGPITITSLDDFTEVEYIGIEHPTTIMIEPGDSLSGTVEQYLESRDPNVSDDEIDRAVALVAIENGRLPPEVFDDLYPEHAFSEGAYLKPVFHDGENINPHLFSPGPINIESLDEMTEREFTGIVLRDAEDRGINTTSLNEDDPLFASTQQDLGIRPFDTTSTGGNELLGNAQYDTSGDRFRTASYALYAAALGLSVVALLAAFSKYDDRRTPSVPPIDGSGGPEPNVWRNRASSMVYPVHSEEKTHTSPRSVVSGVPLESRVADPGNGLERHMSEPPIAAPIATQYVASVLNVSNGSPNQELYGAARNAVLRKARILSSVEQGLDSSYQNDGAEHIVESLSGEHVGARTARKYIKQLADKGHTGARRYLSASKPSGRAKQPGPKKQKAVPTDHQVQSA